nr:imidazole glycerol phosphate synthase subunit HisH [Clostridia bacterium]
MRIGIIDYGMGNLHSVTGALRYIGADSFVSRDMAELSAADALILPGVGAFPLAMENLNSLNMVPFIREQAEKKPLLGICLGMQLLFDVGYEFGECKGLGLIPGKVIRLDDDQEKFEYKIPHMGWNKLSVINDSPLIKGMPENAYVYFVHSYKAVVENRGDLCAATDYGCEITAIVSKGNVYGTQFHPEKSESVGLDILRNFCNII